MVSVDGDLEPVGKPTHEAIEEWAREMGALPLPHHHVWLSFARPPSEKRVRAEIAEYLMRVRKTRNV